MYLIKCTPVHVNIVNEAVPEIIKNKQTNKTKIIWVHTVTKIKMRLYHETE